MIKKYESLVNHYESCLDNHGDNHLGVDWPNKEDMYKRYDIMLDVIREKQTMTLLDFGCGTAGLLGYLQETKKNSVSYAGLDMSEKFVGVAQKKFPNSPFYCCDILTQGDSLPSFDYIVMNGVFTEKRELSFEDMLEYFKKMILTIFHKAEKGISFNVMSKSVDWERDDLFHLSADLLIEFLTREVSRHFIIRNDYGLYEYTVYVYHNASDKDVKK